MQSESKAKKENRAHLDQGARRLKAQAHAHVQSKAKKKNRAHLD